MPDKWFSRDEVAEFCPSCAKKMASLGIRSVRASVLAEAVKDGLSKLGAWDTLPKGWDKDSLKKFWDSLTGEVKHKVTKCIKEMEGKSEVDDAGAFCASLADKMDPGWRSRSASDRVAERYLSKK